MSNVSSRETKSTSPETVLHMPAVAAFNCLSRDGSNRSDPRGIFSRDAHNTTAREDCSSNPVIGHSVHVTDSAAGGSRFFAPFIADDAASDTKKASGALGNVSLQDVVGLQVRWDRTHVDHEHQPNVRFSAREHCNGLFRTHLHHRRNRHPKHHCSTVINGLHNQNFPKTNLTSSEASLYKLPAVDLDTRTWILPSQASAVFSSSMFELAPVGTKCFEPREPSTRVPALVSSASHEVLVNSLRPNFLTGFSSATQSSAAPHRLLDSLHYFVRDCKNSYSSASVIGANAIDTPVNLARSRANSLNDCSEPVQSINDTRCIASNNQHFVQQSAKVPFGFELGLSFNSCGSSSCGSNSSSFDDLDTEALQQSKSGSVPLTCPKKLERQIYRTRRVIGSLSADESANPYDNVILSNKRSMSLSSEPTSPATFDDLSKESSISADFQSNFQQKADDVSAVRPMFNNSSTLNSQAITPPQPFLGDSNFTSEMTPNISGVIVSPTCLIPYVGAVPTDASVAQSHLPLIGKTENSNLIPVNTAQGVVSSIVPGNTGFMPVIQCGGVNNSCIVSSNFNGLLSAPRPGVVSSSHTPILATAPVMYDPKLLCYADAVNVLTPRLSRNCAFNYQLSSLASPASAVIATRIGHNNVHHENSSTTNSLLYSSSALSVSEATPKAVFASEYARKKTLTQLEQTSEYNCLPVRYQSPSVSCTVSYSQQHYTETIRPALLTTLPWCGNVLRNSGPCLSSMTGSQVLADTTRRSGDGSGVVLLNGLSNYTGFSPAVAAAAATAAASASAVASSHREASALSQHHALTGQQPQVVFVNNKFGCIPDMVAQPGGESGQQQNGCMVSWCAPSNRILSNRLFSNLVCGFFQS